MISIQVESPTIEIAQEIIDFFCNPALLEDQPETDITILMPVLTPRQISILEKNITITYETERKEHNRLQITSKKTDLHSFLSNVFQAVSSNMTLAKSALKKGIHIQLNVDASNTLKDLLENKFKDINVIVDEHSPDCSTDPETQAEDTSESKSKNDTEQTRGEPGSETLPTAVESQDIFSVKGYVLTDEGTPISGAQVEAYDQGMLSAKLLGEYQTLSEGSYEIQYSCSQLTRPDKKAADLLIKVLPTEQTEAGDNSQNIVDGAGKIATIDIRVKRRQEKPQSEYNQYIIGIEPLLKEFDSSNQLKEILLEDIVLDDPVIGAQSEQLNFISRKTNLDREQVGLLAGAKRLSSEIKIPAQALYGLFRQGMPTNISELIAQPPSTLRSALTEANTAEIIQLSDSDIENSLQKIQERHITQILEPSNTDEASIGDLLDLLDSKPDGAEQWEVAKKYVQHVDDPEGFFTELKDSALLNPIQTVFKLAEISQNHKSVIAKLHKALGKNPVQEIASFSTSQLADFSEEIRVDNEPDLNYVKTLEASIEDNFPTRFFRYRLAEQAELTYQPKLVEFLDAVSTLELEGQQETPFDIRTTFLDTYLEQAPQELQAIVSDELRGQIKGLQRLYKLTPRYTQVRALEKAGFHSSQQITRLGSNVFQRTFIENYGETPEAKQLAASIYENAQQVSAMALNLFMRYREEVHGILPAAIKAPVDEPEAEYGSGSMALTADTGEGRIGSSSIGFISDEGARGPSRAIANLETLFGEMNLCACEHCQSVYSPAAYLVDLLEFLKDRKTQDGETFQDILLKRRPDIAEIELSCANTNTVVPYIDLVNEILEDAVVKNSSNSLGSSSSYGELGSTPSTGPIQIDPKLLDQGIWPPAIVEQPAQLSGTVEVLQEGKWWNIHKQTHTITIVDEGNGPEEKGRSRQTRGTSAERKAAPQYIDPKAYTILKGAVYPWHLPFDLWLEESRTYLNHLKVPRHELMRTLSPLKEPGARKGLAQVQLLADIATEQLGLSAADRRILKGQGIAFSPWQFWGFTREGDWLRELQNVHTFLERANIEYEELQALLKTRYIRKQQNIQILPYIEAPLDTCNLKDLRLYEVNSDYELGPSAETLQHIHRFIRLQKKIGWTIQELDLALSQLEMNLWLRPNPGDSRTLSTTFSTSPGTISGVGIPEIVGTTGSTGVFEPLVPGSPPVGPVTAQTSDDILFIHLATIRTLKAKLNLSVEQILTFWSPINTHGDHSLYHQLFQNPVISNPINPSFRLLPKTDGGRTWLEASAGMAPNGDSLSDHKSTILAALRISNEDFELLLKWQHLVSGWQLNIDNLSQLYRVTLLSRSVNLSIRDTLTLIALSDDLDPFDTDRTDNTLDFIHRAEQLQASGFSVPELDYLMRHNFDPSQGVHLEEKQLSQALKEIHDELKTLKPSADTLGSQEEQEKLKESQIVAIAQKISNTLNLDGQILYKVLSQWGKTPIQGTVKHIIDAFLDFDFIHPIDAQTKKPKAINTESFPDQTHAYVKLYKIVMVINRLQIQEQLLPWLFKENLQWLNLNNLPDEEPQPNPPVAKLSSWIELLNLVKLQNSLPRGSELLDVIFTEVTQDPTKTEVDFLPLLSQKTGWAEPDLTVLVGQQGFSLTLPDNYLSAYNLQRLQRSFAMLRRLGVSVQECLEWKNLEVTQTVATSIQQAAKAKYDHKEWLNIAKALRDPLREKQREALVAYLISNGQNDLQSAEDSNDLYGHFLIDPEMSACRETSRIKQALSSVQLFIQRCQMNLERISTADSNDDKWKQWEWMKQYRIWEANRKVFFYPENWLEPELRQDKSSIFQELEDEILQNELTKKSSEAAIFHYLEKLDEVSRLENMAICRQEENGEDITHVFGRTYHEPYSYYHRQCSNSTSWSAWERIDLDIEGIHLLPFVWDNRLYLFWPVFSEKNFQKHRNTNLDVAQWDNQESSKSWKEPETFWELKLAWSEYQDEKWLPRKISKVSVHSNPNEVIKLYKKGLSSETRKKIEKGELVLPHLSARAKDEYEFNIRETEDGLLIYYTHTFDFRIIKYDEVFDSIEGTRTIRVPESVEMLGFDRKGFFLKSQKNEISPVQPISQRFRQALSEARSIQNGMAEMIPCKEGLSLDISMRILGYEARQKILDTVPCSRYVERFRILSPYRKDWGLYNSPLVLEDEDRSFWIAPKPGYKKEKVLIGGYKFRLAYHPSSNTFLTYGIQRRFDLLYSKKTQLREKYFSQEYLPIQKGIRERQYSFGNFFASIPTENVDFSSNGLYSLYNWEIFYHIPLLIAKRFSNDQNFSEAQKWLHYIFNPVSTSDEKMPQKYWVTKPFHKISDPKTVKEYYLECDISNLIKDLASGIESDKVEQFKEQIRRWKKHPFQPHIIAKTRIIAYQKAAVIAYLENLLAWADHLFIQYSVESINEAANLYILAQSILGEAPKTITPSRKHLNQTYKKLAKSAISDLSTVMIELEQYTSSISQHSDKETDSSSQFSQTPLPSLKSLYFCVPDNKKILNFWEVVQDRLFKVRHCMDIEGAKRQLPLFQNPIDPTLLVRLKALGSSFEKSLFGGLNTSPNYRFGVLVQTALSLSLEVKQLGNSLLSVLEKQDAEALSQLRNIHEVNFLSEVLNLKEKQVQEVEKNEAVLQTSKQVLQLKKQYYDGLITNGLSSNEKRQINLLQKARQRIDESSAFDKSASGFYAVPRTNIGPFIVGTEFGGMNLGAIASAFSKHASSAASKASNQSTANSMRGQFERRKAEWVYQAELAAKEQSQIDQQIEIAKIRIEILRKELSNHELQLSNSKKVSSFFQDKFSSRELYSWMVGQVSSLYFQSYQLAFNAAKQAEQAYNYELGKRDSEPNFIQYGYWDSLKKGLLSGERLHHDLKRMEVAYLNENERLFELTKHISLATLNSVSLLSLKQTGKCEVSLPEALFDLDYPGHYMRRIKSVSLTIPCVTGPYTNVNCTLSLGKSSVRITAELPSNNYARVLDETETRFHDNWSAATKSIATSTGQNDSGLFELNFRDERYLPFEGAGVIDSRWKLELPDEFRQFDYDTISDVILHIRYTAKDGGEPLKKAAITSLNNTINKMVVDDQGKPLPLPNLFSLKNDFPSQWHRFQHPQKEDAPHTMTFQLDKLRFPYMFQGRNITVNQIDLLLQPSDGQKIDKVSSLQLQSTDAIINISDASQLNGFENTKLKRVSSEQISEIVKGQKCELTAIGDSIKALEDIILLMHYKVTKV